MSKSSNIDKVKVLKEWLLSLKSTQERIKKQEITYKEREY